MVFSSSELKSFFEMRKLSLKNTWHLIFSYSFSSCLSLLSFVVLFGFDGATSLLLLLDLFVLLVLLLFLVKPVAATFLLCKLELIFLLLLLSSSLKSSSKGFCSEG